MIGWWIVVSTLTAEERIHADQKDQRAAILAEWEVGIGGIAWLERLANEGRAVRLCASGYPNCYTAKAADVLPLIESNGIRSSDNGITVFGIDQGEEYAQRSGWMGAVNMNADRIATCSAEQVLTIEAWDQS